MKFSLAGLVLLVTITTGGILPAQNANSQNKNYQLALNPSSPNPVAVKEKVQTANFGLALDPTKERPLVVVRAGLVYLQPGLSNQQIAMIEAEKAKKAEEAKKLVARKQVTRTQSRTYSGSNYPYWDLLVKYASMYGVNPSLMGRIMMAESGGNPFARNKYSGAMGLFQFLPSTWRSWGCGNPYEAECNIAAAARLMAARGTSPWYPSAHAWS